jgi:hypothetical protein
MHEMGNQEDAIARSDAGQVDESQPTFFVTSAKVA